MLRELSVQNLALIEDVRVDLAPGFCAWTGETGAGKSLLLGAIGLLLGERGSPDSIRAGQDELRVTGRFELTRPEQRLAAEEMLQTSIADDELILTRRLSRSGRSAAMVNEQPVAIATLKKLGEMLVDVHGQRENYSLLQPGYQLDLLDAFGKLSDQRAVYVSAADGVRELRRRQRKLAEARSTRSRELTLIRFEQEELEQAKLRPGEPEVIAREREKLVHAQALCQFAGSVVARLSDDDGSVSAVLSKLSRDAGRWSALDKQLADVTRRLAALRPEVADLADVCRDLVEAFEPDPARLNELEHRLALIQRLENKYGKSHAELCLYAETLAEKASEFQAQEDDLTGAEAALKQATNRLVDAAAVLTRARVKVAKRLAVEAQKHLADLGMAKARLDAVLEPIALSGEDVPASGADHLELMLTANPGEPPRPLRKVASGGELSRTLLALKTVLAAHDPVRTLVVFDEIDSNVGGRLGDVLGQKLAMLGASHQVLCITHLPQVASYAEHHWAIRKSTSGKRTSTTVTPLLRPADRIEELAVMLRGEARSETTLKEAGEMLASSRRKRG